MAPAGNSSSDPAELAAGLARLLRPRFGSDVHIDGLQRLSSGASRQTFAFTAIPGAGEAGEAGAAGGAGGAGAEPVALIVQRAEGAGGSGALPMAAEARLLDRAAGAGVPVPELVASSDAGGPLGVACLVTARLPGEALPTRLFREERYAAGVGRLTADAAAALVTIHGLDAAGIGLAGDADQVGVHRGVLDLLSESRPVLEVAHRWLAANRPPPTPGGERVLHGDFRLGNLLVDEGGLRAVLDWELAHLGDPLEDLGWSMIRPWRFDAVRPAGVFPDREPWIAAYEAASGTEVDRGALGWWEVAGTFRWAVICLVQAHRHLGGSTSSVELATIGRRVFECEWDLLGLLARADPEYTGATAQPAPADSTAPAGELHGTTTARVLVQAVRDLLAGAVTESTSGSLRHQVRVAANALGIVARELELGPKQERAHRQRLAELGFGSDAELATAIRQGTADVGPALLSALTADTRDRLLVANPGWLAG